MAKFRSWNKELKCFIRFKNGRYYIENIKGFKGYKGKGSYSYYFNWQNAEQSTKISNIECFTNDKIKVKIGFYEYSQHKHIKTITGVLKFGNTGFYIKDEDTEYYLCSFDWIIKCEVISNIHENKEILNETKRN